MRAHDELTLPAVPPPAPATHPRRDLALVALFAFALVAFARFDPLDGHPRHVENRPMTPWPALIWSPQIFARFDAAFSDHFRGRNALIALQHELVVKGFSSSPGGNVILGRDDWLYFAGEDGHAIDRFVRTTLPVTDEAIARTVTELERRRAWLAARGIAYVVTVAPDKPTIYPEHLPGWIAATPRTHAARSHDVARCALIRRCATSTCARHCARRRPASPSTTAPIRTGTTSAPSSRTKR